MRKRLRPTLLLAGSALTLFAVAPLASASAALACDQNQAAGHNQSDNPDADSYNPDSPDAGSYDPDDSDGSDADNPDADYSDSGNSDDDGSDADNSDDDSPNTDKAVTGDSQTMSVNITSYGFNDNDDGEGNYGTAAMAYPGLHDEPTEGSGTYDDPITFATDENEMAPGTRIYVPFLQKYFVMEDGCVECSDDAEKGIKHVDLWMGPASSQPEPALDDCEASITKTADIIVNPGSSEPVDKTSMFSGGKCTVVQH